MDFGQPNVKIGQKMANGQLVFLALHMHVSTPSKTHAQRQDTHGNN